MAFNDASVRKHLKSFAFTDLFVEDLGWDRKTLSLSVEVAGHTYTLHSTVHKAGLHVFECPPSPGGSIPDYPARRLIERRVAKSFVEHLIIFTDAAKTTQVWQWMKREKDKPVQSRETTWYAAQQGPLVQKLAKLQFTLEEEEQGVSIVHSAGRTRDAFDVEKVTKKFYEAFRKEHAAFLGGIDGFPPPIKGKDGKKEPHPDLQWYTSLTLNRLMFVYFIQKKRFLADDPDYLQTRLKAVRQKRGKDKFHSFYRLFLLHLFHEGLGKQEAERDPELAKLIGKVPYLNGGFFEVHQLERDYPEIDIPDQAFERLFAFFDTWDWVLDTRAPRDLSNPRDRKDEINPDVVGYIFEKYINQKQMGAYYTKEDITGYITQNTIIPFILDRAATDCAVAFQPDGFVWKLLKDDPDHYIYPAVRHGVIDAAGKVISLPAEIAAGIETIAKRAGWNKPADETYALPTETWREHVARRQRCLDLRKKLKAGEIHTVNALVTHNLDVRQFAQDIITNTDGPELLKAVWQPLKNVTVLDPTCGSGAFLFTALQLLEPLYSGCLDKMRAFLDEAERLNDLKRLARLDDFKKTLDGIAKHANEDYFVLKSIIVNNLFGVDIMEEAVEICRLRLFLKLVAQLGPNEKIEPLPDIDFNIRPGNTLVGYATKAQSEDNLNFGGAIDRIEEKAKVMDLSWQKFKAAQEELGLKASFVRTMKEAIRKPLDELRLDLDSILAVAYGQAGKDKLPAFRKSHQPFHWWVEYYGIMRDGGFDVIVGNPPYVEYSEVRKRYTLKGYKTESCGNLYAMCWERAVAVLHPNGRAGLIVPVASVCTDGYAPLQQLLRSNGNCIVSNFNDRPSKLFDGLEHIRLSVILLHKTGTTGKTFSTVYNKWQSVERGTLFHLLHFMDTTALNRGGAMAKIGDGIEASILNKVSADGRSLVDYESPIGKHRIYYTRKLSHFVQILDFIPKMTQDGEKREPSELKELLFGSAAERDVLLSILNSSLFFWLLTVYSDCRNLNRREVEQVKFDLRRASPATVERLSELATELMQGIRDTSKTIEMNYKKHGTIRVQCTYPRLSKDIIDNIDTVLAKHYGMDARELDFIHNIDVKYRMGADEDLNEED